jgi:tetratricopeptide (TPR) repeat protein
MRKAHALLLGFLLAGCATTGAIPSPAELAPGQRPPPGSDEAGLWMQVDRVEEALRTSGRVVMDPRLTAYVRDVVCRVARALCQDIRVYVVQTPYFNASMAPNGAMQLWTGLLLRTENEAQLAYVVAHEMGHYVKRHSIQQWRTLRNTAAATTFFRALTGAAGVGFVGDLGTLAALGGIFAYSREHEREADLVGGELARRAGYDLREAPRIWEALLREQEASGSKSHSIFFATHPATEDRIASLRRLAEASGPVGEPEDIGAEAFQAATLPLRGVWLRDELRRREFAGSQVLLDRLLVNGVRTGELYFFQGELYRLRSAEGDETKALAAYEWALALDGAPADTYRALGLILMKQGQRARARDAFARYLEGRPDAEDRQMVESYVRQLE